MIQEKSKRALIVFIKNPVLGKVKTRLARTIGNEKALQVYLDLVEITKEAVTDKEFDLYVYYSDSVDYQDDWGRFPEKHAQQGVDLGERMRNAFKEVFKKNHDRIIIIGSDCPDVSYSLIDKAFNLLIYSDIVIGPSDDGGYYLLGMNGLNNFMFEYMPWSTEKLLDKTKSKIEEHQLSLIEMETLNDIDNIDDLKQFEQFKSYI